MARVDRIKVLPLGTGSAVPTRERGLAAITIQFNGHLLLFDCGEGTQHRLLSSPLRPTSLEAVFISHLHLDHVIGLPGLLNTLSLLGRREPVIVYGPVGIRELLVTAFSGAHTHLRYELEIFEVTGGVIRDERSHRVECLPLKHVVPSIGYLLEIHGRHECRKIAYCSDTMPCSNAIELSKGADLLIHESTFTEDLSEEAERWGHSTAAQAAKVAAAAKPARLLLTHISARVKDRSRLLEEAQNIFPQTQVAADLVEVEDWAHTFTHDKAA